MKEVLLRFYAELNDFLPQGLRSKAFEREFNIGTSVKDLVEGVGVPHTEIDLILANGEPVAFSYELRQGDRISVFPVFESLDISPVARLRPAPLREPRFVLDSHLGRLARYLRLLGFDTLYRNDLGDRELACISAEEHRILLTRDAGLLKRRIVMRGYWLRETDARRQTAEVIDRFDLVSMITPFQRCMRCNTVLQAIDAHLVMDRVPPMVRQERREFTICPGCDRVYWKGSHHERMLRWIGTLVRRGRKPARLPPPANDRQET